MLASSVAFFFSGNNVFCVFQCEYLVPFKQYDDFLNKKEAKYVLLHCNSTYPMKNEAANLRAMWTLRDVFKCAAGYSGHETGRIVSVSAAAMGATCIERHITLIKTIYFSKFSKISFNIR